MFNFFNQAIPARLALEDCRAFFRRLGGISLIATFFFLPLSVSLMNVAAFLMALCWLFSGKCLELFAILRRSPTALIAVTLFFLLAASLAYTTAPLSYGLDILGKHRKLLYLPIVLSLASDAPLTCRRAVDAFLSGCAALMLISYFKWITTLFGVSIFIDRHGYSVVHYITHSFFIAVFIFFLVERAIGDKRLRPWLLIAALLAGLNLFCLTPGRTGWTVCAALLFFSCLQHFSWRGFAMGVLVLAAFAAITWQSSSIVSQRYHDLFQETEHYRPGAERTSMGQRYDFWHNAISLFAESPWLGKGVGSFPGEQKKLIAGLGQPTTPTDNPHNEYLFRAEENGIAGLLLFIALLAAPLFEVRRNNTPPAIRRQMQGIVLAMALGCLVNSFLFDSQQGHFFILMTGLLLAAGKAKAASNDSETLT
jgi:O-antigen ligase